MCEEVGPLTLCVSPNRRRGCGYASPETRLDASGVFASTGVDPNRFPNVDEERHLHDEARLDRCGLAAARGRVALETRLRVYDLEIDVERYLDTDRLVLEEDEVYGRLLDQVGESESAIWSPFKGNCSKVSLSMK